MLDIVIFLSEGQFRSLAPVLPFLPMKAEVRGNEKGFQNSPGYKEPDWF